MNTRIKEAEKKTEEIETSVGKCVNDAENLQREDDDLVQRKETDMKTTGKFKGNIQPFSRLDSLPGIQYHAASEDFIYFASTKKAYDELFEALNDDSIHMIGLYGEGGCGKTTLVTEVGKQAVDRKMFDKVISITMSQTPDIRAIQAKIADMLNLRLREESPDGRAQRLWLHFKKKKRILIIVDDLWTDFDLKKIGIRVDDVNKHTWKILITTCHKRVCTLMKCQKKIHLELLSEDESWHLFQKFAGIDDEHSAVLNDVPRKICIECMRLPIAIKIVGSLFNERKDTEWQQAYENLRASKASDDEENATSCLKLSYDHLPTQKAKQIFLLCALFPEEYHILTEDLVRYVVGLGRREISSLKSMRNSISAVIKEILDSCLLAPGSVKMHNIARDAALWIANRSDDCKILVNVDKPLSTVAEDNRIRDCFALSSWWYNENPSFCQLHAPNLKMLLVNISAHSSLNSLDLSHLTFEGIQGLEVFSLTINYKIVPISFPSTIQLLTNVRTLRLNGLKLGDISFILSLTGLEVLDLRRCFFNELPIGMTKLKSLKLIDLSECHFLGKTYNRAIGKCSQLEEVYVSKCYPHKYADEIIMDIFCLQNLQRFVLGDPIIPERTRVVQLNKFTIKNLRTSNKNILQIAETLSMNNLSNFHPASGQIRNIIPDMARFVGGMNNLSTLHLINYRGIECIFNTTCDFKEDDMIPRLVELRLKTVYPLTELYHGPPLQLSNAAELYFPKLNQIEVKNCNKLKSVFPFFMVTMLPQLTTLRLSKATQLQEVFRHGRSKMEIALPNLTEVTLVHLPNFVDICHGCKLHAIELLQFNISNCPKIAPALTKIQDETQEVSEDSSSISNDVEDFIYFVSRQNAYDELFETLNDDSIHMIGLYGESGSGKTTLVTEVGKKAEDRKMFDEVISITVTQTPDIRAIQGQTADMLNMELREESEEERARHISLRLTEKKRILLIVDSLWREFNLKDIGICLDDFNKGAWKVVVITSDQHVCTLMNCQKKIHLGILSQDESWILFQKYAQVDDQFSDSMDGVARKLCDECEGLPITIKTLASSLKGKKNTEWESALAKLRDSEALDDHEERVTRPLSCLKLCYDYLPRPEAQLLQVCSLYPQEYHIPTEDLMRYALGLGIQSNRSFIQTLVNKLFELSMQMRGSVKIHGMVRDTALWIPNRSDDCKILVNVDKPLSTVAEDNNIRDCFALSSWWFNENPSFCQLHAPNLKMLLVNIIARSSLNSLDLSPLTFEGIQGLEVFSLTINYKIVPISFPPTIQLLTNVRTLRLNGLKLGDISFIASLTSLEILDLRRCDFKELPIEIGNLRSLKLLDLSECHIFQYHYNGAIGKCSQLEELYASNCYPYKYVYDIILDIGILQNLQRFVLGDPIISQRTRVVQVNDFDISKLRTSNKNILQIAETVSLTGLCGGSENIIPEMVGFVGGMNNLSTLHLTDCEEIECIFDTTCDFQEDEFIPRFVELHLKSMTHLAELCHGPPLQVGRFFEKLELLDIYHCNRLRIIFPRQCNLQNLKILRLYDCLADEVLLSESVAQSLQQLEQLTISNCITLKHLIASGGCKHGSFNTSEEIIPAPTNSHFFMTNLREVKISSCPSLESIFPIFYVEGLPRLQKMEISNSSKLKYVFGECDHEHLSLYQYQNHVLLPHLEDLTLSQLPNLIGMCPEHCHAKWPSQSLWKVNIDNCGRLVTPWYSISSVSPAPKQIWSFQFLQYLTMPILYSISSVGPAPKQIWSFQCLQYLTMGNCKKLICLFSMETHKSLPELMYLSVSNCQELEQIVTANEELVEHPNAELYFPKLKEISVYNCHKLKSLFPLSMVTMLPQLRTLHLRYSTQLQEVFRQSQSHNIMNTMEIVLPNLNVIRLNSLPNFVDICGGYKLHAVKLRELSIDYCPNSARSLKQIQDEIEGSRISNEEDDSPLKHY